MLGSEEARPMELRIASGGLYVSRWMESFVRTSVQFATRRATPRVEQVSVRLARRLSGDVVCHLEAWRAGGSSVRVSVFAAQAFEAIRSAARRLEVALFSPRSDGPQSAGALPQVA